jgi:hypothetical protein
MSNNGHIPLPRFQYLTRTAASVPGIRDLPGEVQRTVSALHLPPNLLGGRRIAISVGSRGITDLPAIVRAICDWLRLQAAQPFVFPAMGSHGGATAEGQRNVLQEYGITSDSVGAEILSDMTTVSLGPTPEGFQVFMDHHAWQADGVLVLNRVKPHTDFSGDIESGLLKMMAIGMGKVEGARECHRWGRKYGPETVIRAMSARVLATGKILCGLAVVENEFHEVCAVRAFRPEGIVTGEEAALTMARRLCPRIPFGGFHLLMVDELGKNISGTGMDTKVIGRGVKLQPREAPEINLVYVRSLTDQSAGNALGVGLADVIHERLYRRVDVKKMYVNARTSLNPIMARLPIWVPSDREALDFALGALGSPDPEKQRVVWIRNTLELSRLAISEALAGEARTLSGWQLSPRFRELEFNPEDDITGSSS